VVSVIGGARPVLAQRIERAVWAVICIDQQEVLWTSVHAASLCVHECCAYASLCTVHTDITEPAIWLCGGVGVACKGGSHANELLEAGVAYQQGSSDDKQTPAQECMTESRHRAA